MHSFSFRKKNEGIQGETKLFFKENACYERSQDRGNGAH